MSLLSLNFAFIKYSRVPAFRNALKAYEDDRVNDALEIIHASQGDLAQELPDTQDLLALMQESRGFVDALADAIETFQNFPHLASGYNRASEIYMQKGQGLHATEVYEAGLKAIGKDGDPEQRSLLQNHRHEMELQFRDFIALLPLEITEYIFQEFSCDFRVHTCTNVSTAWLPKAVYNISSVSTDSYLGPGPVAVSRLWEYIDTLEISSRDASYLMEFFGGLREEPFVGKWKKLTIEERDYDRENPVDLHKIMVQGLTRISQSLAFLTVDTYDLISPMDLLAACPNLASLEYHCSRFPGSVQKKIPQRDKLTRLMAFSGDPHHESFVRELQNVIKATPNVRFAKFQDAIPGVLSVIPQHWRKLRKIYMDTMEQVTLEDEILEGEGVLDICDEFSNLAGLYEYICQERMRLSRLTVHTYDTMSAEITPVQFQVLKYLSITSYQIDNSFQSTVLELIRGAVEVLEELVLIGIETTPKTYEVLARMPRLKRVTLNLGFYDGIDVYLEHLASLGTASPLKSITLHYRGFNDNQGTLLATRIPTLEEIVIVSTFERNEKIDAWIPSLLTGLVHSKSKVERISIPDYAVTRKLLRTLCDLSELRELDVVHYYEFRNEHFTSKNDDAELLSRHSRINVEYQMAKDYSYDLHYFLRHLDIL